MVTIAETLVDGLLNLMILAVPTAFTLSDTNVNILNVVLMYSKAKAELIILNRLKFNVELLIVVAGLKYTILDSPNDKHSELVANEHKALLFMLKDPSKIFYRN